MKPYWLNCYPPSSPNFNMQTLQRFTYRETAERTAKRYRILWGEPYARVLVQPKGRAA